MQEAAVELLDAAIVSCPPYCRRRTRPPPTAAKAEDLPAETAARTAPPSTFEAASALASGRGADVGRFRACKFLDYFLTMEVGG